MKTTKLFTTKELTLFTQDDLNDFEQIRIEAYSKYEKGNPQFVNENYDSWVRGKIEGKSAYTTTSKRALWALVGYDHSVANNCIKDFIRSGDLMYLLNAIEVLWTKAFQCPVIMNIILSLNNIYSKSLWIGDKATSKMIESFFEGIGLKFLFDNPQIIKPHKAKLTIRRLQNKLSNKYNKKYSKEDTLMHIIDVYKANYDQLNRQPVFQIGVDKNKIIENNKSLLLKTENKLKLAKDPKQIADLKREKTDLTAHIFQLNNLEDKLHQEARKLTIKYIENKTGIKLGGTYFKNILSMAYKLNQD